MGAENFGLWSNVPQETSNILYYTASSFLALNGLFNALVYRMHCHLIRGPQLADVTVAPSWDTHRPVAGRRSRNLNDSTSSLMNPLHDCLDLKTQGVGAVPEESTDALSLSTDGVGRTC